MDSIIGQRFGLETQNAWCSGWDDVRRSLHLMPIASPSPYPARVKADWAKNGDRGASRNHTHRMPRQATVNTLQERTRNESARQCWLAEWFAAAAMLRRRLPTKN